jgi:hypothetical protein
VDANEPESASPRRREAAPLPEVCSADVLVGFDAVNFWVTVNDPAADTPWLAVLN